MTYPLHQRELTVQLDNGDWHANPIEGTDILGPIVGIPVTLYTSNQSDLDH
jgi:hypothetical protein